MHNHTSNKTKRTCLKYDQQRHLAVEKILVDCTVPFDQPTVLVQRFPIDILLRRFCLRHLRDGFGHIPRELVVQIRQTFILKESKLV